MGGGVGGDQVAGNGGAARGGVLDNDHGGAPTLTAQLGGAAHGAVGVHDVVEGKRLALQLHGGLTGVTATVDTVKRGALVRVFAVAQVGFFAQSQGERGGEMFALALTAGGGKIIGDATVVTRGVRKGLGREGAAGGGGDAAVFFNLGLHRCVVGRVGDDGDGVVVFGRGAQQRRAANVNVVHGSAEIAAAGDGFGKWVKVDGDQINGADAVRGGGLVVHAAPGEDGAVDERVQGFDAAVHDFGKAGACGNFGDADAGLLN